MDLQEAVYATTKKDVTMTLGTPGTNLMISTYIRKAEASLMKQNCLDLDQSEYFTGQQSEYFKSKQKSMGPKSIFSKKSQGSFQFKISSSNKGAKFKCNAGLVKILEHDIFSET